MKQFITIIIIIILIPYVITLIYNKEQEDIINYEFNSNTLIRVKREETGEIVSINLEEYVLGVICGELPALFDIEALKAGSVAARSYVLYKLPTTTSLEYDIIDTVTNQVYVDDEYLKTKWGSNYNEYISKMKSAVYDTMGIVAMYDGKPANTLYFSTSTGKTENSGEVFTTQLPYLVSVDSVYDYEVSPVFEETKEFSKKEFNTLLNLENNETLDFKKISTTSTGRNKEVMINGTKFKASEVTGALKLRSNYYNIIEKDDKIIVTTKGYGHGVGMSQYGAQGFAKHGYTYEEILKHYYTGIYLEKL